jgi:hypothetical protein
MPYRAPSAGRPVAGCRTRGWAGDPNRGRVGVVTLLDPGLVDVRTSADHPLVDAGSSALRMVAPGAVTAGRSGLVEYRLTPRTGGAAPHFHSDEPATFLILFTPGIAREEFSAEMAELQRSGRTPSPEEMTAFYARHDQVMVDV